jgi:hypothetical protein
MFGTGGLGLGIVSFHVAPRFIEKEILYNCELLN